MSDELLPQDPNHPYWRGDEAAVAAVREAFKSRYRDEEPSEQQPVSRKASAPAPIDPRDPLFDASSPAHLAAVRQERARYEAEDPPEPASERPSIHDMRRAAGTEMPQLPQQYAERWDTDAESDYLAYTSRELIPGQVAQGIMKHFAQTVIFAGGKPSAERLVEAEADFRRSYAQFLTPKQLDTLVRYGRALLDDSK